MKGEELKCSDCGIEFKDMSDQFCHPQDYDLEEPRHFCKSCYEKISANLVRWNFTGQIGKRASHFVIKID